MPVISVQMVFRKKHIRCFVESLSIHKHATKGVIEFEPRDKLNNVVRSYLTTPPENARPLFGPQVVNILVPRSWRQSRYHYNSYLPKSAWKDLEAEFEDLFFLMWYNIEKSGVVSPGKRKYAREKFLNMCGIYEDVMSEDSFRKAFDRFLEKKTLKIIDFLENQEMTTQTLYESVV